MLVADDAQTNRMVIRLFLEPLGVQTVEAADGTAAVSVLARGHFDAGFVDIHMPGMDGPELAARIRQGEAGRTDLPLIAVSGSQRPDTLSDDFDAWLGKPIDPAKLCTALERALSGEDALRSGEKGSGGAKAAAPRS